MTQINRLAGGQVNPDQPLKFKFDGKSFTGQQGDTLASALLANGVRLMGRSFKYHRPRGVLTAGSEEPNALVELRLAFTIRPSCGLRCSGRKSTNRSFAMRLASVPSLCKTILTSMTKGFCTATYSSLALAPQVFQPHLSLGAAALE